MYDVIIIGAGVSGTSIARELSRYKVKARVLERAEDVCCGTSKANSGIIHAGYDAAPGSLMAKLNVQGNQMMGELSRELDFPFRKTGSFVICTDGADMTKLQELYERGIQNGVKGLRILSREEAMKMEPNLAEQTVAALYAPTAGIVCPFSLNIAMAENAYTNGIQFSFGTEVQKIEKAEKGYRIQTSKGLFDTKYVVNAAGVYADGGDSCNGMQGAFPWCTKYSGISSGGNLFSGNGTASGKYRRISAGAQSRDSWFR